MKGRYEMLDKIIEEMKKKGLKEVTIDELKKAIIETVGVISYNSLKDYINALLMTGKIKPTERRYIFRIGDNLAENKS